MGIKIPPMLAKGIAQGDTFITDIKVDGADPTTTVKSYLCILVKAAVVV